MSVSVSKRFKTQAVRSQVFLGLNAGLGFVSSSEVSKPTLGATQAFQSHNAGSLFNQG